MANLKFDKEITALLVIDPYNDFISGGGKVWDRLKTVAEANDCVPHMLQVMNAARKAELRIVYALHRRGRFISPSADAERFERVSVGRSVVAKSLEGGIMKRIAFVLVAVATVAAIGHRNRPRNGISPDQLV